MTIYKRFLQTNMYKLIIREFLTERLKRAVIVDLDIEKTPLGHRVVIVAERPGLVIGRHGSTLRELERILTQRFGLENPQIAVVPVSAPELNAKVLASRIAFALQRGVHFRRAAFIAIRQAMEGGARGIEITISGKLVTERARTEKFRSGILLKAGHPKEVLVDEAEAFVLLKPGVYGIKVTIMPPEAKFPDQPRIKMPEEIGEEIKAAPAEGASSKAGEEGGGGS